MKNKSFQYALAGLAILFLLSVSSCSCNRRAPGQNDPANYVYYLGASPAAGLGDAKAAAAKLLGPNLTGSFISNTGDGNVYYTDKNDPTVRFQQDPATGSFSFSRSLAGYLGDMKPSLPSMTEASSVARDYLKNTGLLPADEKQLHVTHVGGVKSSSVINGSKRGEDIDKMRTVVFTRAIDSVGVVGPGSKIVVQLGDKNALVGMAYRWKNLSKDKPRKFVPLTEQITQADAQNEVKQRVIGEFGENVQYTVISGRKMLYDGDQNTLQPVYAFEVAVRAAIGKGQVGMYQYLYLIQAMKQSPEPIQIATVPPEAKRLIDTVNLRANRPRPDSTAKE